MPAPARMMVLPPRHGDQLKPSTGEKFVHSLLVGPRPSALPGQGIGPMKPPPKIVGYDRVPDEQAGPRNVDGGSPDPETAGTVLFPGGELIRADEKVGEPEIVDQLRSQQASDTQNAL